MGAWLSLVTQPGPHRRKRGTPQHAGRPTRLCCPGFTRCSQNSLWTGTLRGCGLRCQRRVFGSANHPAPVVSITCHCIDATQFFFV